MKLKFNFNSDILAAAFKDAEERMTPYKETLSNSTLAHLPVGVAARVVAVNGTGAVTRRLMEMGVVPGAHVSVIRIAPLGDPMQIRVRGYHLALRRTEAQTITVSAVADER